MWLIPGCGQDHKQDCFCTLCITLKPTELKTPKKLSGADISGPCIRFL